MPDMRAGAAKYIARSLKEPYETQLGCEPAHDLLATAFADRCCSPSGHRISWQDCYAAANLYPLPLKAGLLLDPAGRALPVPRHLTGDAADSARAAGAVAEWIRQESCWMPLGNQK